MNDARWRIVQDLFLAARDLPADARDAYLRAAMPDDDALRVEVERMLDADADDGILDRTAPSLTLTGYASDSPVEERVGPYFVTGEIGRGGMGVVYRAYDPRLRRDVALKFLPGAWSEDPEAKSRLIDEARAASALDHPNTCPVYDIGSSGDGRFYIAMAYCAGGSLAARLTSGPLSIDEAVKVAVQVAAALDRAHEAGIVHRDIKPANIAFTERGDARVLDFGIALLGTSEWAVPGAAAGTPAYMAPEQVHGEPVDRRTDVWALGAVLFEMLTGTRPFSGLSEEVTRAILASEADVRALRPEVPEALSACVRRALAKEPRERFGTAAELSAAITSAVVPRATREPPGAPPAHRSRLTRRLLVAGVMAAAAAAAWMTLRPNMPSDSPALDSKAVAILPFRVHGEPSLAYLREGMVDLLAAKLTGEGGLRAADPRAVYAGWRRAVTNDADDLPRDSAVALARRLGTGLVLLGDIVGTPAGAVVNASVVNARGTVVGRATAQGPHTALPAVVDRLVAQLLSANAGEDPQRLDALTSTSLPALRAYLDGQASYRRGRYAESLVHFRRALDLDSTFALAGLGLSLADGWAGTGHARERGRAAAWRWRERLSQRDRALLTAHIGPSYPRQSTVRQRFAAIEAALRLAPDHVELWYELGDLHYHFGRLLGVGSWESQAEKALRRAVASDSTFSAPIHHLVGLYAHQGSGSANDLRTIVAASRRFVNEGATADYIRWRAGVALGEPAVDSAALDSMASETLAWIGMKSQDDGVDRRLGERALRVREARPGTREERLERRLSLHAIALNGGRPGDAAALSESMRELEPDSAFHLRLRVLSALYGDGDRSAAAQSATALGALRTAEDAEAWLNGCVRAQWQLAVGEPAPTVTVPATTTRDRTPAERLCGATLEAMRAVQGRDRSALQAIDRLEQLLRSGVAEFYPGDGHLDYASAALARLREHTGDRAGALAALRYRHYFIGWQPFLATSLREEGRLAAELGDREGAIRAYEHHLALRHDPEPAIQPSTDSVRAELTRLKGAR